MSQTQNAGQREWMLDVDVDGDGDGDGDGEGMGRLLGGGEETHVNEQPPGKGSRA
jgi:hypothetical protein